MPHEPTSGLQVMKSMRNLQLLQQQDPSCPKKEVWDPANDKIKGHTRTTPLATRTRLNHQVIIQ